MKGGQQGQEAEDASEELNLERLIQAWQDNIPGVPIVCEGPEGRLATECLGLSHAKLSGHAGVGDSGGGGGLWSPPSSGQARPRVSRAEPGEVQTLGEPPSGLRPEGEGGCLVDGKGGLRLVLIITTQPCHPLNSQDSHLPARGWGSDLRNELPKASQMPHALTPSLGPEQSAVPPAYGPPTRTGAVGLHPNAALSPSRPGSQRGTGRVALPAQAPEPVAMAAWGLGLPCSGAKPEAEDFLG